MNSTSPFSVSEKSICFSKISFLGNFAPIAERGSFIFTSFSSFEIIATKSGIGDSGGNGDYSTYRVVLVVKTKMSIEELNEEFESRNLTFSSHNVNSDKPICYITHCEDSVFTSDREFTLNFDELEQVEDFNDYYFIEFIK